MRITAGVKIPIVLLLAGILPAAAITITDDFNDGVIDTSIWNASTPFPQSQVFEENGSAVPDRAGRTG